MINEMVNLKKGNILEMRKVIKFLHLMSELFEINLIIYILNEYDIPKV